MKSNPASHETAAAGDAQRAQARGASAHPRDARARAARPRGHRASTTSARSTRRSRTDATFIDNAVLKARAAASQCDLITIADDSGITIDALNGMPGMLVGALGRQARRRRGQPAARPRSAAPTYPTIGSAPPSSAPPRSWCPAPIAARSPRSGCSATSCANAPGRERLRLRPDLRRARRDADQRRVRARAQGPDQPSGEGAAGARPLHQDGAR